MDINVLVQWSNKWLLHFNTGKYKVMSLGHSVHHHYCMTDHSGTHIMSEPVKKRTLASLSDNLKASVQCTKAAARARSVLTMLTG